MVRMILAAFLASVALPASSKTTLLEHLSLQWRPPPALQLGTAQMTAVTVTSAPFTDGRDNKEVIGENREDNMARPVTTTDDVGTFVSTNIRRLFDQAGVKTVDSNGEV